MEFGKVDNVLLNTIDFRLPEDGSFTKALAKGKTQPKVYVGGAKWGRKGWVGRIYPDGTKEKDFLEHYVKSFNGIELNTTHYQFYPAAAIEKWAEKAAGKDFKFCPKVPQAISHYGDLSSAKAQHDTDRFLAGIMAFGEHLGPIFLQLSERYGPQRKEALYTYLSKWPKDVPLVLELRHPAWFEEPLKHELFSLLHETGTGTIITDVADRRDCLHMEVTSPYVMIRFVGNGMHPTDYTRIDAWVQRIGHWLTKDIKEIHFYMHQPDEIYTPQMTGYVVEQLDKVCGLALEGPRFVGGDQGELF